MSKVKRTNILFVCSMNQWRSPTAEKIYQRNQLMNVRSRGTSRKAKRPVTHADLDWADLVLVMENKHLQRLQSHYPGEMRFKEAAVLDIPDEYQFMDPDLIKEIENAVEPILIENLKSED